MAFWSNNDNYGIQDDDDSSDPACSSSEDEIDIILKGTPGQKRKLKRLHNRIGNKDQEVQNSSSSEDDFEKEMNAELAQHVNFIEGNRDPSALLNPPSRTNRQTTSMDEEVHQEMFYDNVYFDSDEEENGGVPSASQETGKHAIISNDDLLYDPTMDDKDQRWVDRQRRRNNNTRLQDVLSAAQKKQKRQGKLPTSDALLDCPACMTTLCLDCQRHDTYKHQYRAMFVMNCEIDNTQMLECPDQQTKRKKKKKKTPLDTDSSSTPQATTATGPVSGADLFHAVKCTECSTVVGVIDSDEVYHFFNVLASHT